MDRNIFEAKIYKLVAERSNAKDTESIGFTCHKVMSLFGHNTIVYYKQFIESHIPSGQNSLRIYQGIPLADLALINMRRELVLYAFLWEALDTKLYLKF